MTPVWGYSSPDTKHFGPAAGSPARPTRQPELSPTEEGLPGSRGRSSRESSTRRPPVTTSCQMGRPCPCHRRGLRCGQPPCWPTAQSTACLSWAPPPRPRPTFQVPSQAAASRVVPPARPAAWGGRGAWPERWVHVPASSSQVQPVVVSLPMGSGEERPSLSPQMVPAEPLRAEKADPSPE